jgi:hypothetical protein
MGVVSGLRDKTVLGQNSQQNQQPRLKDEDQEKINQGGSDSEPNRWHAGNGL